MKWQDAALGMAGVIGSSVAVVHGILIQRLMVRPFEEFFIADPRLFVGGLYLYGAVCNLWVTRGPHPGWMLMAVALVLIALGVHKSVG